MSSDRDNSSSTVDLETGDAPALIAASDKVVRRSYSVPWLAHTCMEPMNALARVSGGSCEIWTGTQNPLAFKHAVAEALDIDSDTVAIHNHLMGGGFGRRSIPIRRFRQRVWPDTQVLR